MISLERGCASRGWSPQFEHLGALQVKCGFLVRMVFLDRGCTSLGSRMLSMASLDRACDCANRVWRMCKPRMVLLASGRMPQPMRGSPPTTLPPPLSTNTSTDHNQSLGNSDTLKPFYQIGHLLDEVKLSSDMNI